MKTVCAWCHPAKPGDPPMSHGVCAYHALLALQQAGIAEPADYEAAWQELEPRAVPFSVTHNIILPFFLACVAVGLSLAASEWAMRVLPEVLK